MVALENSFIQHTKQSGGLCTSAAQLASAAYDADALPTVVQSEALGYAKYILYHKYVHIMVEYNLKSMSNTNAFHKTFHLYCLCGSHFGQQFSHG